MTLRSLAGAVTLSLVAALAVPVAAQAHSRRCYRDRYYSSSYGGYYRPYSYNYDSYNYGSYSYRPYYRSRSYYRPSYSYRYYPRRHYRSGVSLFFGF
jgi:hypothetical protein